MHAERTLYALYQYHPSTSTTGFPRTPSVFPALRCILCTVGRPNVTTIASLALIGTHVDRIHILRSMSFEDAVDQLKKEPLPPRLRSADPQRHCADALSKGLPILHATLHTLDLRGIELTVGNLRVIATLPLLRTLTLCLSRWNFASQRSGNRGTPAQTTTYFRNLWSLTVSFSEEEIGRAHV